MRYLLIILSLFTLLLTSCYNKERAISNIPEIYTEIDTLPVSIVGRDVYIWYPDSMITDPNNISMLHAVDINEVSLMQGFNWFAMAYGYVAILLTLCIIGVFFMKGIENQNDDNNDYNM